MPKKPKVFYKPRIENNLPIVTNPDFDLAQSIYNFTVRDLNYQPVKLEKYFDKVCIIVNVASKTPGFTYHNYKLFNKLYEKYAQQGVRILAFPCNQFNNQEPGTNDDIKKFIHDMNIKFDVFDRINVNCYEAHPLMRYLKYKLDPVKRYRVITDPFTKFFVNRSGLPYTRLQPGASEEEIVQVLNELLYPGKEEEVKFYKKIDLPPPKAPDNRPCARPWRFEPGHLELI